MTAIQTLRPQKLQKDSSTEEDFLATVLLTGDTFGAPAEGFLDKKLRDIFQACLALEGNGEAINEAAVFSLMKTQGKKVNPVLLAELAERILPFLHGRVPMEIAHYYVRNFVEYYQARLYAKLLLERLTEQDQNDISEQIASLQERLEELKDLAKRKEIASARLAAKNTIELLEKGQLTGPGTGFPLLDRKMGGWLPGNMTIICGRPSMGKTAFMLSSIFHTRKRHSHLVLSLEMPKEQLMLRFICMKTGLEFLRLLKARKQPEMWEQIMPALAEIGESHISILDENRLSLLEVEQLIRAEAPDVLWVDYIGMLNNALPGSFQNREREIAAYSAFFKTIAKKYNLPVIVICQLNRASAKENRPPTLHDLRESGAIEQDADLVLAVHANSTELHNERQILILKGRNLAKGHIKLAWDGPRMLFYESAFTAQGEV